MKATTKVRNPSKVSSTSEGVQKTLSSQSRSWLLRKLTKYRSSDQEGLTTPQFLYKMKTRTKASNHTKLRVTLIGTVQGQYVSYCLTDNEYFTVVKLSLTVAFIKSWKVQ